MKNILQKSVLIALITISAFAGKVYGQMSILLVNDNSANPERITPIENAITNNGYSYTLYDAENLGSSPDSTYMSGFDLVIWYTGNDGVGLWFWNGTDNDNPHIKSYIDNGGMFWLQGLDFLYDRYGTAPDSFVAGNFVYDYLGIQEYHAQSHSDDGGTGVAQLDVVPGNPIFTFTPMQWVWSTMWYADALVPTPNADSIYRMGPAGYVFDSYYNSIYLEKGSGKILSIATETGKIDTQANTDTYIGEGLTYFQQFVTVPVSVDSIHVYTQNGDSTITIDNGTLQMEAEVFPSNASDTTVAWSIVPVTATATIDNNGLLQATGTPAGNGTLWVKATAMDGSGVTDSMMITISNQGSSFDFHVLLVNDNNYSSTRYYELDTALTDLGYNYDIYNTVVTDTFPDTATLNKYEAVIWYTGNDGVALKLWDISDTTDYKFNAPLIQYIDSGGIVWLQGLDYLYDVVGTAPDTFTQGQFIYDYMGIEEYHGQSHLDDGGTGMSKMDTVLNNGIFTLNPVQWTYSELWFADALVTAPGAKGVYHMGPASYVFSGYNCGVYKYQTGGGIVMNFAVETARIDTQANTDSLIDQGLSFFDSYIDGLVYVDSIYVYGENGDTTITQNGGTLQMYADVFPYCVPDTNVVWSVVPGTATATISTTGLLQATGTPAGNGTVWVKATAADGGGTADSVMITISNQGTGSNFFVLLVNDNNYGSTRYLELDTALNDLGYTYDIYNTVTTGTYPDSTTLMNYDVVIWYTGNDGVNLKLWNVSDTTDYKFNAPLINYIDNGGIVWLQGLDYLYDVVGGAPDTFTQGQFIYDYLGIEEYHGQSHIDDGGTGMSEMDTVLNNGIFTLNPVQWTYSELWYADALVPTEEGRGVYHMGPASYTFSDYLCGLYKYETNGGLIMNFSVETARIDTQANTDTLIGQGLSFFEYYLNNTITVDSIDVYGEGGVTTITQDSGTLQMYADVFPQYAPNTGVVWSVIPGTATATISEDGLLQATGTPAGNGTVWVKAVAADGGGAADSVMITISNQGTGINYLVLLVNDNDYDPDRYLELDTALMDLGYVYDIYNTVETGTYPDYALLSQYTTVIWYTGNDGVDLKLWDTSDTSNYQFNAPLKQYIDNGGIVWLQGLDFLYDVVGGAPDIFTQGQFIYDYLGIEEYHAQSYVDDGNTGLPEMDTVTDNGIFSLSPVYWTYSTLWYADALVTGEGGRGVYHMGPAAYQFSNYLCGLYKYQSGGGMVMSFTVETARIDTQANTDTLIGQGLSFFEYYLNNTIFADSISVYGENGDTTITVNAGTLQMYADVFPQYTPNTDVVWSVVPGTATATISEDGLLQATGTPAGNGTVWVKAVAADGGGAADSVMITISNQGGSSGFPILLVNDNDYAVDRYLVIDTTLFDLGYDYDIYNTVETGTYPDSATLSAYKLVIWYTGNDGVDLKLWDTSDTSDYKFNAPLVNYINNGGFVWVQGLDFLYDIYGSAPDSFTPGQFIYDYMGIEEYHAQSYADDGGEGLPEMDVVPGNGICTLSPVQWVYATLWFADALQPTVGTNTIYSMGPSNYVFADYFTAIDRWIGEGNVMTFTIETARIDTRENTEELFYEVIEYFMGTVGIHQQNQEIKTNVYPNPATGRITVKVANTHNANTTFVLYNMNGSKVFEKTLNFNTSDRITLSLDNLKPGIYVYKTISENGMLSSGKIIKQ